MTKKEIESYYSKKAPVLGICDARRYIQGSNNPSFDTVALIGKAASSALADRHKMKRTLNR